MSNFVLDSMDQGLTALQTVKTLDYNAAYREAFGGGHCLRPAQSESAAEWFEGRCLALELVTRLWSEHQKASL